MRLPLLLLVATAALTGAALAHAQTGYDTRQGAGQQRDGQSGYGRSDYGQPSRPGQGADDSYDDEADDRQAPPPGARPPGGADYADADSAPPDLGRDLGLRSDQRGALQAYEQATGPNEADAQRMQADVQRLIGMTTPQRLDFTAQEMQRDQADFTRRSAAVRRFYGQLTPQQQQRFDRITAPQADDGAQGDSQQGDRAGASPR